MASPPDYVQDQPESLNILVLDRSETSNSFHVRSNSAASIGRQSSPSPSPRLGSSRFASEDGCSDTPNGVSSPWSSLVGLFLDQKQSQVKRGLKRKGGAVRVWYQRKRVKGLVGVIALVGLFFLVNWFMLLRLQDDQVVSLQDHSSQNSSSVTVSVKRKWKKIGKGKRQLKGYERMLALAAHTLAENKPAPKDLWEEPFVPASAWKPCADLRNWAPNGGNNGYIMVTANGGINQQRVAVCNAVVVARLLNSTLVIPTFMYSSVWKDVSQFGDIYQEEHFLKQLSPDIQIVKELPKELRSLDLEAIGSIVTDADVRKEAKPSFYMKNILPIILKNGVVHFIGFGNRLAFDPIPFDLQRLRCRCNFHALQFVPKIQQTGALLLQRLRKHAVHPGPLDHHLVGSCAEPNIKEKHGGAVKASKYLALHLRFEIDMVAHSLCEYGGGEEEGKELELYREIHFPALTHLKKTKNLPSPAALRSEGLCPLTPEEAVLMLAALGFNRKTRIFVAGANIYGGERRLNALTSLYPNLVTKEKLLSSAELQPFLNFSSQLAVLDFIGCTAADAFAMTDSGSQLSSLVSGYRIYYGGGRMPNIRPNKRRLAAIFMKNNTIEWKVFEQRIRKAVRQTKHVFERPTARSVYRYPRCKECMCFTEQNNG